MADVCTCGAKLPEDARFCHKCGKPQREEPLLVEEEAAPVPPPPPQLPPPQPIGFHNRIAVRAALSTGVLAVLLSSVSGPLFLMWLAAGGFFAVYLYRRRTGEKLSVLSGAHLGWISGIFGFVLVTLIVTFAVVTLTQTDMLPQLREQMKAYSFSEKDLDQVLEMFRTPSGIASLLATTFVSFTILPAVGGAVGAKLLGRD